MTATTTPHQLRETIQGFTFRELATREWPKPEYLIDPWLRAGESAMIWAATGVGKTMLSLTLALMVAGGGKAAGWNSPEKRKVLILDGEMKGGDLVDRLKFLAGCVEGIDREAALDNIEVRARTLQKMETDFYDLGNDATQLELRRYIEEQEIGLIIFDNVTTLTDTMGDENSVEAIKPVLKLLMDLKRTDVSVIVIHHSNKGGNSYRGSTALATTFEVILGLTKPESLPIGQTAFKLEFPKFRAKAEASLLPRLFRLGETGWIVSEDEDDETTRLIRAIQSCNFATQEEAGRSIGISDKTKVSRLLRRACANGKITRTEIKRCLDTDLSERPDWADGYDLAEEVELC